jgi:mono/diheme cytochrome c family protein
MRAPVLLFLLIVALAGCRDSVVEFEPNLLVQRRLAEQADIDLEPGLAGVQDHLESLFGTPNAPNWPSSRLQVGNSSVVNAEQLRLGGGAVGREDDKVEKGVYRKHCAACHGVTGNGLGPTAQMLNPYPRDYTRGTFKYKSTPIGARPTSADLHKTLMAGIPGTGMPSFATLTQSEYFKDDINTMVNYVRYLAIRGEVERRLLELLAFEIDIEGGEGISDDQVDGILNEIVSKWASAPQSMIAIDTSAETYFADAADATVEMPTTYWESVERGRELFHGTLTACSTCHGSNGGGLDELASQTTLDYDEWTKDWTVRAGIDPEDKSEVKPLRSLGGLPPRKIIPRNLQKGVFHGGGTPEDLYLRIVGGIEGSPMPAVAMQPNVAVGLTTSQVWDLVNFVLSLSRGDQPSGQEVARAE